MQSFLNLEPPTGRVTKQRTVELVEHRAGHFAVPRALELGVAWESPWREFCTSVRDFFRGPRPPKDGEVSGDPVLRVQWVRGKLPRRALFASSLWHVAGILITTLPIWSFLAKTTPNLAPVRLELTWEAPAQDLPPISLPGPAGRPRPLNEPPAQRGADAYHPRQTILSMPVRVTHPRQTLIQPDAPPAPPKIEPQLPNIVQWAASAPQPKLRLQISPVAAAPRIRHRAIHGVDAPEIANLEKNPGPLNIAATPAVNSQPQMPVNPMSAAVAERRQANPETGAAPEIGPVASEGDSLRRLIAISATPAPPAPEVSVPQGNLAARIAISPEGTRPGIPGGAEHGPAEGGSGPGASGVSTGGASGGDLGSLPAAVHISGGNNRSGSGGITLAGSHSARGPILKPMRSLPERPDLMAPSREGPAVVGKIDPNLPPEKILSGKEVYTLHVNMPNLTSISGSWVLNFTQLDEGGALPSQQEGRLSGPVPLRKVDPKYPPSAVKQHIEGEVVLYAIIRKDGSVDSIQLVRGIDPQLDLNSMEALARWKFQPATRQGAPVELETVVHIPFQFRNGRD